MSSQIIRRLYNRTQSVHRVFGDRQVWRGGGRTKASALKWGKSGKKSCQAINMFYLFLQSSSRQRDKPLLAEVILSNKPGGLEKETGGHSVQSIQRRKSAGTVGRLLASKSLLRKS